MRARALAMAWLLAAPTVDVLLLTRHAPAGLVVEGTTLRRDVEARDLAAALRLPEDRWRLILPGGATRTVSGSLEIRRRGAALDVVARVPLETYVAEAVAAETLPGTAPAALEAQAIVARSYARAAARRHGHADVCDLAHCQVLPGPATASASPPRAHLAAARAAAARTAGRVLLLRDGSVARATFHACCGGRTAEPAAVFGGRDRTGAASVLDAGCALDPAARWQAELDRKVLLAASRALGLGAGELRLVRSSDGRVAQVVSASGSARAGDAWVRALDRELGWGVVRSARLEMSLTGHRVLLRGSGAGHGVGLCQRGSARRAAAGAPSADILALYFPCARVGEAR